MADLTTLTTQEKQHLINLKYQEIHAHSTRETLCWTCKRSYDTIEWDCTWHNADNPKPISGWTAKEGMVDGQKSYCVSYCPNFELDLSRSQELPDLYPVIAWWTEYTTGTAISIRTFYRRLPQIIDEYNAANPDLPIAKTMTDAEFAEYWKDVDLAEFIAEALGTNS